MFDSYPTCRKAKIERIRREREEEARKERERLRDAARELRAKQREEEEKRKEEEEKRKEEKAKKRNRSRDRSRWASPHLRNVWTVWYHHPGPKKLNFDFFIILLIIIHIKWYGYALNLEKVPK